MEEMYDAETRKAPKEMKNANLHKAKKEKNDEFYTQLSDIYNELNHYREHFKGKVVLCNCDDPRESNFFEYFSTNFELLGLKKLITTCYDKDAWEAVYHIYEGDVNGNRVVDDEEVKVSRMKGNGDFRSPESIEFLKEADIVVTNPPFSLFREYIAQLIEYDKKFLVLGNINALTCKEIFPLVKDTKIWIGVNNGAKTYILPDKTTQKLGNTVWYTNLDHYKRHEEIILAQQYDPDGLHPTYDNYDAIECKHVKNIPINYDGAIGVPISYLTRHNPDQFEILGADYQVKQGLLPISNPEWNGKIDRGYINNERIYARIIIRNKQLQQGTNQ